MTNKNKLIHNWLIPAMIFSTGVLFGCEEKRLKLSLQLKGKRLINRTF